MTFSEWKSVVKETMGDASTFNAVPDFQLQELYRDGDNPYQAAWWVAKGQKHPEAVKA